MANAKIFRTRLLVSVLCLSTLLGFDPSTSVAKDGKHGAITEVGSENWETVPAIPKGLPWKRSSISDAKKVLKALERILQEELAALKASGAVKVRTETRTPDWPDFWFEATNRRWTSTRYVGLDSDSKIVASTPWDPETNVFYARHLVKLNSKQCSLRDFNLFDFSTWFETRCEVKSTSPEALLGASLQELLGQGLRDLPAYTDFELKKLDYALSHNLKCKKTDRLLQCENLGTFTSNGGPDSVNLSTETGGWDYEISVNLESRKASITYLKPRPKLFAKKTDWRLSDYLEGDWETPKLVIAKG